MTPDEQEVLRDRLARANKIRAHRADLKRQMAAREMTLADVSRAEDPMLASMRVIELVQAVPGMGRKKAARAVAANHFAMTTRLRNVTPKRREELLSWLVANHPKLRDRIA